MATIVPGTLTLTEAAAELGISRGTVYERAKQVDENGQRWLVPGQVPILDMGPRLKRVPRATLERYIATGCGRPSGDS